LFKKNRRGLQGLLVALCVIVCVLSFAVGGSRLNPGIKEDFAALDGLLVAFVLYIRTVFNIFKYHYVGG
jgi:hypothetical protein